ncbi:MAG: class I SAM-dependent methyltransferase, partial [Lachnospiraceae bacterium]|nr:class I SAM-dependent methyltransferase [Lachnospiraceae bacterium]
TDEQKVGFLKDLRERLAEGGMILVGDVAFATREDLERCRREAGDEWDDEEVYFVADEMRKDFPELVFHQVSYCEGILAIPGRTGE